jgi:hypothetical protein
LFPLLGKYITPNVFSISQYHFYEFCPLIISSFFFGRHLLTLIRHRYGAAVTSAAKEKSEQKYYYTDNAAACDKPTAGDTATVINV